MASDARIAGFAPLVGDAPRILLLGSMPSVASLEQQQYYGKPQNAFWKIMGELFSAGPELPYSDRVNALTARGIAVWDVLASCVRPGSLDSAIDMRTAEVNDFVGFLSTHAMISHVFFNGRKAEDVYQRPVLTDVGPIRPAMVYTGLPSTSPAMAAMNFEQKLTRWSTVSSVLDSMDNH
jgi:TDG/mug DNA glycosylase family protein